MKKIFLAAVLLTTSLTTMAQFNPNTELESPIKFTANTHADSISGILFNALKSYKETSDSVRIFVPQITRSGNTITLSDVNNNTIRCTSSSNSNMGVQSTSCSFSSQRFAATKSADSTAAVLHNVLEASYNTTRDYRGPGNRVKQIKGGTFLIEDSSASLICYAKSKTSTMTYSCEIVFKAVAE